MSDDAPHSVSGNSPVGMGRNGHYKTTPEDIKWHPVCTRGNGSLRDENKRRTDVQDDCTKYFVKVNGHQNHPELNPGKCVERSLQSLEQLFFKIFKCNTGKWCVTSTGPRMDM